MTLGEHQRLMARYLPLLLMRMLVEGYLYRVSWVKRCDDCPVGKKNSNHKIWLAYDIDLFDSGGNYISDTESHRVFGEFWEQLHPKFRWGGRFGDGNHYSMLYRGVM